MSVDNGIYILKTKDQYRVTYAMAIDNLWFSFLTRDESQELVPTRIIEYFGNCKYTRHEETAMRVANAMAKQQPILEYGISRIPINKTWKQIVDEAKELAVKEIEAITNEYQNDGRWNSDLKQLQNIIDNY